MNNSTATAEILPFQFETREVRTLLIDDQPWFMAMDIASALHYTDAQAMTRKLDEDEIQNRQIVGFGPRGVALINESGLYSAILRSRKPEAKRFKKWVTAEVLPAIRKHGHYHDAEGKMNTLIGQTIGTDGFHMLGALIKGKVTHLSPRAQRCAISKIWSQTHAAFGVRSGADIPAAQLDAARNFIAAYALEGDWLPAEPNHRLEATDQVNLHTLCGHVLRIRAIYKQYYLYEALSQLGSPAGKELYGHIIDSAAIARRYQPSLQPLMS